MYKPHIIISCEHAGNEVPPSLQYLFRGKSQLLSGHRGFDCYALETAQVFAEILAAPLYSFTVTRLLIDVNRSLKHPTLFSELSRRLSDELKKELIDQYYLPYRQSIEQHLKRLTRKKLALHLSIHTFTPVLDGIARTADAGFLYDPVRSAEQRFCRLWINTLQEMYTCLRTRRNYPYLGTAEGFVTSLRKQFGQERYLGIDLELNQRLLSIPHRERSRTQRLLAQSLISLIEKYFSPDV